MRLRDRTLAVPSSPIGAHAHLLDRVPIHAPLLDLSQGAPGFPPAPVVAERMADVARRADGSRYAPLRGLDHVRDALVADLAAHYASQVSVDDVCITTGCNQAFANVVSTLADPGDEVVLVVPYYFNHDMWLRLESIHPVHLVPANGLSPTPEELRAALTERTRAVVLVTPGNPTGHIIDPDVLDALVDVAAAHDVAVIVDETYRSFVPGGGPPHDLFTRADWREHVVSLHSFSKDLAIPGCRVGAIVASPALLIEVAKSLDCVTICPPRIGQEAVHAGLTEAREWRAAKVAEIAEKQRRFDDVLSTRPGGFERRSSGAYYGWVHHPFDAPTDVIVEALVLEQGMLTIPGTAFTPTDEQMIRFSFANVDLDRIAEIGPRLTAFGEGR